MEGEAAMSRTPIRPDDPDLGHLAGVIIATGEDRIVVNRVTGGPEGPTSIKSVRLPDSMIAAAEAANHAGGFSGVLREALNEWLDRHTGSPAIEISEARRALDVLQRIVGHLGAAA